MQISGTAHTIATKCVEAACQQYAQGYCGLSSGWAQDEIRKQAKRIRKLLGNGLITVDIHTSWNGERRLIIDNDNGYFDHVIAA